MDDGIWLNYAFERRAGEVVVGAKDGEFRLFEDASHVLHAEVELVIAHRTGIATHAVHQLYLDIALEHGVVGRPLREVAAVEIQQVGMLLSFLLYHFHAPKKAAAPGDGRVGQVFAQRHDAAMRVVGV